MAKYHGKHYYLGAWNYVFLNILYAIPIVGLIFLLIHSFSEKNENRRHYARSYFAGFLLIFIIVTIVAVAFYLANGQEAFIGKTKEFFQQIQSFGKTD